MENYIGLLLFLWIVLGGAVVMGIATRT